jgi:hypothetical protein
MINVYLSSDKIALISEEDAPLIQPRNWFAQYNKHSSKWYAWAWILVEGRKVKRYMHRLITGCPPGLVVDHENGDGLHNWRGNLRVTTHRFNAANCCAFGEVPYRGVVKEGRRFRARINGKHIGTFEHAEEAALAYDEAAVAEWGAFAWRNFPLPIATTVTEDIPWP